MYKDNAGNMIRPRIFRQVLDGLLCDCVVRRYQSTEAIVVSSRIPGGKSQVLNLSYLHNLFTARHAPFNAKFGFFSAEGNAYGGIRL